MKIITGKHNIARVFSDTLDDTTREQILTFVGHPAFAGKPIAIMPDCHAGKGACIGFTMPLNDYVIPNIVGVDIGCGMLATCYGRIEIDPKAIDAVVHERIPSGFGINTMPTGYGASEDCRFVCKDIGIDPEKALKGCGSLGGGNHFIEFDKDADGNVWSVIHSGSRNFGLKVANYYHSKAIEGMGKYFVEAKDGIAFIPESNNDGYYGYINAMQTAQMFATASRSEMEIRLRESLHLVALDQFESIHNFISDDGIIRKGATSAKEGERCIIPFNSVDGTAICVGKGNPMWNYSAPHGAGRKMSRTKAKELLSVDIMRSMFDTHGIYTSTADKSTLDESPEAYKPMNEILEQIKETVDVVTMLKPFYNFKASGE